VNLDVRNNEKCNVQFLSFVFKFCVFQYRNFCFTKFFYKLKIILNKFLIFLKMLLFSVDITLEGELKDYKVDT